MMINTWTLGGFSVEIIADRVTNFEKDGYRYAALPNRTYYKIKLENKSEMKCDVVVKIDGEKAGAWRLDPYQTSIVERPVQVNKKFYFVKETSREADMAGVRVGQSNNGIIDVEFLPEKRQRVFYDSYSTLGRDSFWEVSKGIRAFGVDFPTSTNFSANSKSYGETEGLTFNTNNSFSSGATILGDSSSQFFDSVSAIKEVDNEKKQKVVIRLVVDNAYEKPYITLAEANRRKLSETPPRIEEMAHIPKVRIYEDFHLMNRINPYDSLPSIPF